MSGLLERAEARVCEAVAAVAARLRSERPDESAKWLDWAERFAAGNRSENWAQISKGLAYAQVQRALASNDREAWKLWCDALAAATAARRFCLAEDWARDALGEAEGLLGIEPSEAASAPAGERSATVAPKRRRAAAALVDGQADLFGGAS